MDFRNPAIPLSFGEVKHFVLDKRDRKKEIKNCGMVNLHGTYDWGCVV